MREVFIAALFLVSINAKADALLDVMTLIWSQPKQEEAKEAEVSYTDFPNDSEAEVYHWELGSPDNIPETEIIYESEPCQY
jgi:hypothetical protein